MSGAFLVAFLVVVVIIAWLACIKTEPRGQNWSAPRRAGRIQPKPHPAAPVTGNCLGCGADLSFIGIESLRVGGTSGGWKLLFGEWAELGEAMLDVEIHACTACRRIDFRVPPGRQNG